MPRLEAQTRGGRRRTLARVVLVVVAGSAVSLLVLVGPGVRQTQAVAVTQRVALTLSAHPNPAPDGAAITWTGTVTPLNGPTANVALHMEGLARSGDNPTACEPSADCRLDSQTKEPYWLFPMLTAKTTISASWRVDSGLSPPIVARLWLDGPDNVGCGGGSCPASASLRGPTLRASLAYTPSGQVLTGTTLHFTVTGTTNVGPITADLHPILPPGLGPPTNIKPASAVWGGPSYNYIDDNGSFSGRTTLTFDAKVTALTGTNLKVKTQFMSAYVWNPGSPIVITTIHVGPVATPTPKATPTARPTPTPGSGASAQPSAAAPSALPTASPGAVESPIASSEAASAEPSASPALAEISAGTGSSAGPTNSGQAAGASGGPPTGAVVGVAALAGALLLGLGAVVFSRRPRT